MAQTTDVMNSSLFKCYMDGTAIGYSNQVSVSITHSPREVTNKDDGAFQRFLEGPIGGTAQVGMFYAEDAAHGLDEVWTALVARTTVALLIGYDNSGDTTISADAYITSVDQESPGHNDNVSASVSYQMTGTIARSVEA